MLYKVHDLSCCPVKVAGSSCASLPHAPALTIGVVGGGNIVKKKRKPTQAVKTLPASIQEKKIPRAEAPCIPFTKRNKKEVKGDQEGY
eukprot:1148537-Pelagomonas_calceolata.AAC.1